MPTGRCDPRLPEASGRPPNKRRCCRARGRARSYIRRQRTDCSSCSVPAGRSCRWWIASAGDHRVAVCGRLGLPVDSKHCRTACAPFLAGAHHSVLDSRCGHPPAWSWHDRNADRVQPTALQNSRARARHPWRTSKSDPRPGVGQRSEGSHASGYARERPASRARGDGVIEWACLPHQRHCVVKGPDGNDGFGSITRRPAKPRVWVSECHPAASMTRP